MFLEPNGFMLFAEALAVLSVEFNQRLTRWFLSLPVCTAHQGPLHGRRTREDYFAMRKHTHAQTSSGEMCTDYVSYFWHFLSRWEMVTGLIQYCFVLFLTANSGLCPRENHDMLFPLFLFYGMKSIYAAHNASTRRDAWSLFPPLTHEASAECHNEWKIRKFIVNGIEPSI